jgi:hypothetical protein
MDLKKSPYKLLLTSILIAILIVAISVLSFKDTQTKDDLEKQAKLSEGYRAEMINLANEVREWQESYEKKAESPEKCSEEYIQDQLKTLDEKNKEIKNLNLETLKYSDEKCEFDFESEIDIHIKALDSKNFIDGLEYYIGSKFGISYRSGEGSNMVKKIGVYNFSEHKVDIIKEFAFKDKYLLDTTDISFNTSTRYSYDQKRDGMFFTLDSIGYGSGGHNCITKLEDIDKECIKTPDAINAACKSGFLGTWYYNFSTKKVTRINPSVSTCNP